MNDNLILFFRNLDRGLALGAGPRFAGEFLADLKAGFAACTGDVDGHEEVRIAECGLLIQRQELVSQTVG
jgi:hypothetical protein